MTEGAPEGPAAKYQRQMQYLVHAMDVLAASVEVGHKNEVWIHNSAVRVTSECLKAVLEIDGGGAGARDAQQEAIRLALGSLQTAHDVLSEGKERNEKARVTHMINCIREYAQGVLGMPVPAESTTK